MYLYGKNLNFDEENKDGESPLYVAAAKGSTEVVGLLVTLNEVNINHSNKNKQKMGSGATRKPCNEKKNVKFVISMLNP